MRESGKERKNLQLFSSRCHVELNHGPFGLQPKALPLSYNTKYFSKRRKKDPDLSDTGNRTRGDWVRARHVTYYTISETIIRRPGIEPGSTEPQSVIMPLYNRRMNKTNQVLAGDRTLGLPRVKRAICQLSYENQQKRKFAFSVISDTLEIGGIDPPTCRMRIDRSTT